MEFTNENKTIRLDDFNRNYTVIDNINNLVLKHVNNVLELNDMEAYLENARRIQCFSNVYYNITKRCSLKCTYCYSENSSDYVSLTKNKEVLTRLENLNARTITLIGGEPLCHPYFYDLLEGTKTRRGIEEICIVTNGTMIDHEKIEVFKDKRIFLQISLDGINEETNSKTRGKGSFEKVEKNFEILKKNGIRFKLMKVITRLNINSSIQFYEHYKKTVSK